MLPLLRCALTSLCLLAYSSASPQIEPQPEVTATPPPAWVERHAFTPRDQIKATPSGQDFLLLDRQTNLETRETYHHRAFQVVSEVGRRDGAQIRINFDPTYESLAIHRINVSRNGELSDRLDISKIQILQQEEELDRQLYNGQRSALLILDDVRVGDVIELAYTTLGRNPVFGDHYISIVPWGWGVPIKEQRFRLLAPEDRTVLYQMQGPVPDTLESTSHTREGRRETHWVAHDLEAIEPEDQVPDSVVIYPFLELTEYSNWSDVVDWALPLYAIDPTASPLEIPELEAAWANADNDEELVLAALRFVQEEVRYLGIEMGPGSHHPSDPTEVVRRRFGDCKDKSRLLVQLLRSQGIQAAPALVHSSRHQNLKHWLPSPYAFNHVIVSVDLGNMRYLLDPTMSYQRGDRLSLRNLGRYGPYLRIAPGVANLEESAYQNADITHVQIFETYDVSALDQPTSLKIETRFTGDAAHNVRAYFASQSREQIGRNYLNFYTHYIADISSQQPPHYSDNPDTNQITVTENYIIKSLFKSNGDNPTLYAEFYPAALRSYLPSANFNQRQSPFALNHPEEIFSSTVINLPKDWTIENSQTPVSAPHFEFLQTTKYDSRQLVLHYKWRTKQNIVSTDHLQIFGTHLDEARNSLGYHLSYNPAIAEQRFALHRPMAGLAIGVVILGLFGVFMLGRMKNPTPPEPLPPPIFPEPPPDPYSYSNRATPPPVGLGGWLILVALGLLIRPIALAALVIQSSPAYFNEHIRQVLTNPNSDAFQPYFAYFAAAELTLNLISLLFCLLLLIMFFRRSYLFPRSIQIYFAYSIAISIYSIWASSQYVHITSEDLAETHRTLVQVLVAAVIWIPYFSVSKRVKLTFTR